METIENTDKPKPIVKIPLNENGEKIKRKYTKKILNKVVENDIIPAQIIEDVVEPVIEPVVEEVVIVKKEKKPRSDKQKEAFERARQKRLANLGKITEEVKEITKDADLEDKVVQKAIAVKRRQHRAKKILNEVVEDYEEPKPLIKQQFVFA
jgi:hypothetical protein